MESARAKEVKVRESSERERRDMRSGMAESARGGRAGDECGAWRGAAASGAKEGRGNRCFRWWGGGSGGDELPGLINRAAKMNVT